MISILEKQRKLSNGEVVFEIGNVFVYLRNADTSGSVDRLRSSRCQAN
jgi:hypothetical protein